MPVMLSLPVLSLPVLSSPVLWLTGLQRWLLLAGLSVALGGLAGRGLARQYKGTPGPAALPLPWALRGSLLGLAASAALLVTAVAGPVTAARLARPRVLGLPPDATAVIAVAELACFAAAALLARQQQAGWSATALLGVVTAEGIRSHPEGIVPFAGALLTYCHLLPAVIWAGMLLYTLRAAVAWRASPAAAAGLIRFYGTAAAWLFAIVVITGVGSALLLVPFSSLLTSTYGRFLIVKAILVAVVAGLAVAGRVWLTRTRAQPTGPAPLAARLECAGLAAVLLLAALLTVLTPPGKPVYSALPRVPVPARSAQAGLPRGRPFRPGQFRPGQFRPGQFRPGPGTAASPRIIAPNSSKDRL